MKNSKAHIWLRAETLRMEPRTPLAPADAALLIEQGLKVTVEASPQRVFSDEEYTAVGCTLVPSGSWVNAPKDAFILGLKDLPSANTPLVHQHIFFGHVFKGQPAAANLLKRFHDGQGTLLDHEYLLGKDGKRVVGTGYWAGYVGAALGVWNWARQIRSKGTLSALTPFASMQELVQAINRDLIAIPFRPKVVVIGAKGRSGIGAVDLVKDLGLQATGWGRAETEAGGPFPQLLDFDVVVNCIGLEEPVKPFLNRDMLENRERLTVISDVSCDIGNPCNVFPWNDRTTSFSAPVRRYLQSPILDIIAIDRLPALLPRECSEQFSSEMAPLLVDLPKGNKVWKNAEKKFREVMALTFRQNKKANAKRG